MMQCCLQSLHIAEHQRAIEAKVIGDLEAIQDALEPMEKERQKIAIKAERSKDMILYCNYFLHCATAGFLARLTWWEYSWDIMEPGKKTNCSHVMYLHSVQFT